MKNLKKLKAVLAQELENRAVYKEAFDIVKDAEKLQEYVKELSAEAQAVQKEVDKFKERGEKAKADTLELEKEYADQAEAIQVAHKATADEHEKKMSSITEEATKEVDLADAKVKELLKKSKGLQKTIEELEATKTDLETKVEEIRGKLKSI